MNNSVMEIAERIKGLRSAVGKTAEQMAEEIGVTTEEYYRAEAGELDFAFTFLYRCAGALGIDVSELITGKSATLNTWQVVRKGEGLPLEPREGFAYYNLASLKKDKLSQPYFVVAKHSNTLENSPISLTQHASEEFDYVVKGTLKVQVEDHIEVLHEGDCIYYDSTKPHGMVAVGKDCEFIAVVVHGTAEEFKLPHEVHEKYESDNDKDYDYSKCVFHKFVKVKEDEHGALQEIKFTPTRNFNFAFDVVDAVADKNPNKRAMLWLSKDKEERDFSFGDMKRLSNKAANYFKAKGIKKGDRVMLVLQRHYQFWIAILALHKLGAIVIPATHLLVKHDFEYRFQAAGVKAIVATSENDVPHQVDMAQETSPTLQIKMVVGENRDGWDNFDAEMEKYSDVFERPRGDEDVTNDDLMLMYFTSGTTGYPKIAAHNFLYPLGHLITARYWHHVDPNGLHFTIADTGWGKAVWGKLYGQWLCEAAVFTYDFTKFDAHDILPLFKKYNITTFCAPPTMYRFFIKEDLSKYDLSMLKHTTIAGEALNPEVFEQWLKATGLKLMEGFGQTETTLTIANLVGMEPKPGSMGKPSPQYDVDLLDADGNPVKVGEQGEICVRTRYGAPCGLFAGYYLDEEKTKEAWDNDIYHTGDMAWKDEDGYYWYIGRTDDVIKSSGYRIGPFEIESVIMELPYVLECAVTGTPDPIRGQVVKATIVLTKGKEASDELKKEIQNYVKVHTAPYKYPRVVEFVEALPKTISGKIRRVALRGEGK